MQSVPPVALLQSYRHNNLLLEALQRQFSCLPQLYSYLYFLLLLTIVIFFFNDIDNPVALLQSYRHNNLLLDALQRRFSCLSQLYSYLYFLLLLTIVIFFFNDIDNPVALLHSNIDTKTFSLMHCNGKGLSVFLSVLATFLYLFVCWQCP